jgi:2-oxo-3-hexenedioate decarboxylase
MDVCALAALLDDAACTATPVQQLSETGHAVDIDTAYAIQARSVQRRIDRGETLAGIKMGFTSRAKMQQMGVSDLIWGRLTDAMRIANGARLPLSRFIHPRAEPEIAFRLRHALAGQVTLEQARQAVDAVAPAIEIIDSRYRDFRFSLADVVADNSSSSAFVLGEWVAADLLGADELPISLSIDSTVAQSGSSAAILGDPWQSLVEAARLVAVSGLALQPGWVVLAGAATAAVALRPGMRVSASAGILGSVAFEATEN